MNHELYLGAHCKRVVPDFSLTLAQSPRFPTASALQISPIPNQIYREIVEQPHDWVEHYASLFLSPAPASICECSTIH